MISKDNELVLFIFCVCLVSISKKFQGLHQVVVLNLTAQPRVMGRALPWVGSVCFCTQLLRQCNLIPLECSFLNIAVCYFSISVAFLGPAVKKGVIREGPGVLAKDLLDCSPLSPSFFAAYVAQYAHVSYLFLQRQSKSGNRIQTLPRALLY